MKQQLIKKLTQFAIATCLLAIPALAQFGDSVTEGVGFPQQCCWAFTTHAFWLPDPDKWSIIAGSAAVSISDGPNGTTVANLKVSAPGSLTAAYELPQVSDLRGYDSFNFVSEINNTRIGGLVLLVDSSSHRRWYQLILQAAMGWRQPVYSINNYVGEDPAFDLSRVAFIWFNQRCAGSR